MAEGINNIHDFYSKLVLGASESIDILYTPIWQRHAEGKGVPSIFQVVPEADRRLRLRNIYLLPSGTKLDMIANDLQLSRVMGFNARVLIGRSSRDALVVDGREAIISDHSEDSTDVKYYGVTDSRIVSSIQQYFNDLWSISTDPTATERSEILFDRIFDLVLPKDEIKVISIANKEWGSIIKHLASNPDLLYTLSSREFEELVAELFRCEGYNVSLTTVSRDGGKDLLVSSTGIIGEQLYLVECKRYSPKRRVGVSVVREIYGTVCQIDATAGIIVTTSSFSKDALAFREPIKWRMALRDYENLSKWLRRLQDQQIQVIRA